MHTSLSAVSLARHVSAIGRNLCSYWRQPVQLLETTCAAIGDDHHAVKRHKLGLSIPKYHQKLWGKLQPPPWREAKRDVSSCSPLNDCTLYNTLVYPKSFRNFNDEFHLPLLMRLACLLIAPLGS